MKDRKLLGKITYKPVSAIASVFVAGFISILLFRNVFGLIFGGFCILLSGAVFILIKDHPVMDVYEDRLIVYDPSSDFSPVTVHVSDIVQWEVNRNQNPVITIVNSQKMQISVVSYQIRKASSLLKKILPGKSTEDLAIRNSRNSQKKNRRNVMFGFLNHKKGKVYGNQCK